MKRIILITFLIVGLTATYSIADMDDHMSSGQGMMGSGRGMMGQGNHPCMEGEGMMDSVYQGNDPEAYQKFMDDTAVLRKKLHDKKFEYSEAARNPDTTRKSLLKLEKEMIDIKWKIYEQAPEE